ncbi:MAG: 30S ribosomal protein S4 [Fimbriimonas ginsengisoli]|uniref:Small ribosomal subunit protein uS4 n=1 Tax=Fimbriimonas ginsengisoli TaxID=1005039 RepID=A0A931LSK4_FIMGI|nr:30S ribosomal protein S4 [Fimbriimonas ginsengisoli]MBI3722310.1 30S ribosomal protein S4 [Fimbriimonas ginsengisoli]
MATYRGRKTDICRTVGYNIWGQPKCPSSKRPYPLGQHGPNLKDRRQSEYGEQLLAKQVIRRYYNLLEKQFANTFHKAQRMRGNTSMNFLRLLELRLSTIVWRLGFARTIFQARQMVSHCHVLVNGRVVNIASFQLSVGDVIEVRDRESSRGIARANHYEAAAIPPYLDADIVNFKGKVVALPEREDFPKFFQEQQVVEFYAR